MTMSERAGFVLRLASFYSVQFLLLGAYLPYFPLWLYARGLTADEIAIVLAAPSFARVLFTPLIGFAADRAGDRRRVLKALGWGSVLACGALALAQGFTLILALSVAFTLFWTAVMPLTETLAMAGVRRSGLDYGRMRLWGSLAFVAASVGGGVMIEAWGAGSALWLIGAGALAIALAAYALPAPRADEGRRAAGATVLRARDAFSLAGSRQFVLFVASASAVQAAHAVYYAFGTLHWRMIGLSGGTIGVLWTVGVLAEIALFSQSRRVVAAVGAAPLIAVAGLAAVLRWSLTAFDPPLWLLVPVQALHGLTFGAAHVGAVHFIAETVPEERAATAQALYAAVTGGLMMGLATWAAGPLYAHFAAHAHFAMAGLALLGLSGAVQLVRMRRRAM